MSWVGFNPSPFRWNLKGNHNHGKSLETRFSICYELHYAEQTIEDSGRLLNFWSLSKFSIVLEKRLCLKRFFPISFRSIGLCLLWWWDILGWVLIIERLVRMARLHCALQVWRCILGWNSWCVMGQKTGNRLILMMDEVTYILYTW